MAETGRVGPVVRAAAAVTLVGGAPVGPGDLRDALALAPVLVAADGGADAALAAGLDPVAVIGDMDSLSPRAAAAYAGRLHAVADQDSTDFDKALTRIDAPLVVALGFAGGRLDHELAALHALVLRADRPCLLIGAATLTFHCPPALLLPLAAGTVVSLFPFADVRVDSEGLRWPTGGIAFAPDRRVGTSNEAVGGEAVGGPAGGPVRLRARGRGMLVILPRAALGAAFAALGAAPRWAASPDA